MGKDPASTTAPQNTVVTVISKQPKTEEDRRACLVVIVGDEIGRRVELSDRDLVIGRSSKADLQVDQDSVSRNHAALLHGKNGYILRDMGSTNGSYVNDQPIREQPLRDGDQIRIGRAIFKFIRSNNVEAQYHEEIYRLMTLDGLTQVHNKRFFHEALEKEVARARRYERHFSIVIFDIDHFKKINDTEGHLAGDAVLRKLGPLVKGRVRTNDTVARVGGEEFAVLLPEVGVEGAAMLAEKLRAMVATAHFPFEDRNIPVTISLGCTEWKPDMETGEAMMKAADEKLYEAKNGGRNRVVS